MNDYEITWTELHKVKLQDTSAEKAKEQFMVLLEDVAFDNDKTLVEGTIQEITEIR